MYPISPCNIITTKTITSFKIDRIEITLFKSAIITVILLDSASSILDVKFINMTNEEYTLWSADDSYVIKFIKQKLGFSNIVAQPPQEPVPQETIVESQETIVEEPVPQETIVESQETIVEEPVPQEQTDE
jgi:hypothetical protein